jgi:hypothetical protein
MEVKLRKMGPGSRHSASKTRVNALKALGRDTSLAIPMPALGVLTHIEFV